VLYRLTPQILALPGADELREANRALQREVASRRQAEGELTRAKAELELRVGTSTRQAEHTATVLDRFFEEAPLGLAVLDANLRFIRVNPALTAATGRASSAYLGHSVEDAARFPKRAAEAFRQVARRGTPQSRVEVSRTDDQGRERHWVLSIFPIQLGGATQIGSIVQDFTYQRQIEQQRMEALAAAQHASSAKDQFLAKVSHELRSPLQIALSSAEVLKRIPNLPPPAPKFIDRLAHAISMQARMISDLLDVSRILSGKLHIANEVVDPVLPFLRVLDHWIGVARLRQVTIDASGLQPGQTLVNADPARLEQIFANLLDNAIRFSSPEGKVEIGADVLGGNRWRFFVRDHGAGLDPGEAEQIFRPFSQGQRQPAGGKGLGLGLAIVKSLVDAFGGRVWAESAGPGQGTAFCVELPVEVEATEPTSAFGAVEDAPRLDGLHILYVEDEPDVAYAMQEELERLGAEVSVATSYGAAMERIAGATIDVLVSDLNLGQGPGGIDVVRGLRAMPRHAAVPAVAVSAYGTEEDQRETFGAGFAGHLVKPVNSAVVAAAIRKLLA
jgi:PAS domain S-box-containing protein